MKNNTKKIVGYTGPSKFTPEIISMIEDSNCVPIYLGQNKHEDLDYLYNLCDGIVLGGGSDWSPISRGEEITNGESFSKFDLKRDLRELYLIEKIVKEKKPTLAICRGFQGLGLFLGLPFINDINGSKIVHSPSSAGIELEDFSPCHFVKCRDNFKSEFWDREYVNSFHHQAVEYNSKFNYENCSIEVIATAQTDFGSVRGNTVYSPSKIVEVMRVIDSPILGVQFHPEADYTINKASLIIVDKFIKSLNE